MFADRKHVAIVMDGNGRWAKQRGLARTAGHEAGELALVDIVHGAIEIAKRITSNSPRSNPSNSGSRGDDDATS